LRHYGEQERATSTVQSLEPSSTTKTSTESMDGISFEIPLSTKGKVAASLKKARYYHYRLHCTPQWQRFRLWYECRKAPL
jgi:hypothetical protein